jgi:hypothetical protein
MNIRDDNRSDDFRCVATYRSVAFEAVQRRLARRVSLRGWTEAGCPRCPVFERIRGVRVAAAVGLLGLALSFWSTHNASASTRFSAARTENGSLVGDYSVPAWLATINRYRVAAGLATVRDRPAWDVGLEHHLTYLQRTPAAYFSGRYQSLHTENPSSPYRTADGAAEARYSDLVPGGAFTPVQAVDEWLTAPFHAIGMLRAQLRRVALADAPVSGFAGLDVIRGLDYSLPAATAPILFPGRGVATDLLTFGGESPNPLETCGWQNGPPVGLPLIIMLRRAPVQALGATVTGPTGTESTANGTLCVVDEHTYRSSDPVYGPIGRFILRADHAVILIPRDPLTRGSYSVGFHQPGCPDIDWTFSAYPRSRRSR